MGAAEASRRLEKAKVTSSFKTESSLLQTRLGSLEAQMRDALQTRSCLCNESVKAHLDGVLRSVYPTDAD